MSEDHETDVEEARLAKTMARLGGGQTSQPRINAVSLQEKSLKPTTTNDKSQPFVPNTQKQLVNEISGPHELKHTEVQDKSKPAVQGATVKKNVHGQLFNEINSTEKKPALKPTTTEDKSKPVIENVQLRKSERPQLMSDIKEAGGTEVRAGSTNQKAAMFEKEISDQKKATEKKEKKTVWAPKSGQNNYGKKVVYAKPEGGPPPKKSLAELL